MVVYLNGYKLQYFVKDSKAMRCISAVCRKLVHSLHFFMNCYLLPFGIHLLPLMLCLSTSSTLHSLIKDATALKMIKWVPFSSKPGSEKHENDFLLWAHQ